MGKTIVYVLLGLAVIWLVYSRFAGVSGLRELNAADFQQELAASNGYVLIDVREPSEVRDGYIKGALNIPLGQLSSRLNEVPRDKKVMLYCRSGNRSKQAAKVLLDNDYKEVTHLQGGVLSWPGALQK
jgi:rhodanese-related sulfurtransferase